MGLVLTTPPAREPVSLDDLKHHLRIIDDSEDELVEGYGTAARQLMESTKYPGLGIAMITQTWTLTLDEFPRRGDPIYLPKPPLQSVTSITTTSITGAVVTLAPNVDYTVDISTPLGVGTGPARIFPVIGSGWPSTSLRTVNGVTIVMKVGFGDTEADIPVPLKIALMMMAGTFYEGREAAAVDISAYDRLAGLYRQDYAA